jgi:hypothetical protein
LRTFPQSANATLPPLPAFAFEARQTFENNPLIMTQKKMKRKKNDITIKQSKMKKRCTLNLLNRKFFQSP